MNSHTESPSRLTLSRFFTWFLGFLLASSMSFAGVASPPVVEMALSPDTVGIGSNTELTITVDNTVNPGPISQLAFTLPMPAGVTVRALSSECGGTLTTENNGSLLRFSGGAVETSSTCEIKALVTQNIRGPHNLTIDDFTSEVGPSAPARVSLKNWQE